MRRALALSAFLLLNTSSHADPSDTTVRARRHTLADQSVVLRTHAHWDSNCRSTTDPRITWVVEPAHGKVDQEVAMVKGHAAVVGTTSCEGFEMRGLELSYRPEPGFRGVDTLSYDVRYDPRNPLVRYEFQVTVE